LLSAHRCASVRDPLFIADGQFARFKTSQDILCGEPSGQHPICPGGQGGETVIDRVRFVAVSVQPIGKIVNISSGCTISQALASY